MAAITSGVIAAGTAGYQIYQGEQKKKQAKADMNEYERADLENAFENIQISTIGSDLMRDEVMRGSASLVDAMQQGGSRMVAAGLPRIQKGIQEGANEARNYLDSQVQTRDRLIAEDEANLRGVRENRDIQNLSAISSEYNAGNQDVWSGMLGLASSAMSIGRTVQDNRANPISTAQGQPQTSTATSQVESGNPIFSRPQQTVSFDPMSNNYPSGNNPGYLQPIEGQPLDAFNYPINRNPYMTYDPSFGLDGKNFITQGTYKPFV
ncbi:MAG TPA: hypothetical protein VKX40_08245 [Aequorivita sp.]|nr:hypothetical protein [Aequorivita sp.]